MDVLYVLCVVCRVIYISFPFYISTPHTEYPFFFLGVFGEVTTVAPSYVNDPSRPSVLYILLYRINVRQIDTLRVFPTVAVGYSIR